MNRPAPATPGTAFRPFPAALLLLLLVLFTGSCGSDTSSIFEGERTFWATDITTDNSYPVRARPLAVGSHCYVYVEAGAAVDAATAQAVASWFDDNVYYQLRDAFGEEPNPDGRIVVDPDNTAKDIVVGDADGDPRIYLLLLDIRDGYRPERDMRDGFDPPVGEPRRRSAAGYSVSGYFDWWNEMAGAFAEPSNRKEILFLDVEPNVVKDSADPTGLTERFRRTMAHQFQHMIHWEQKTHRLKVKNNAADFPPARREKGNGFDEPWLDEAMSMVAPYYTGLTEVDREARTLFERNSPDSLTDWGGKAVDYATAYMWGEFLRERCSDNVYYKTAPFLTGNTVFRKILGENQGGNEFTGFRSVNFAFGFSANDDSVFKRLFYNWAMSCFYGDNTFLADKISPKDTFRLPDNTVMTKEQVLYTLFDTWRSEGTGVWSVSGWGNVLLGLLNGEAPLNRTALSTLGPWSFAVYRYDNSHNNLTWNPSLENHSAMMIGDNLALPLYRNSKEVLSLLDNGATVSVDNVPLPYAGQAWIILLNDQSVPLHGNDNVVLGVSP